MRRAPAYISAIRIATGKTLADDEFGSKRACGEFIPAAMELGPHVASLGMRFYTGMTFPESYRRIER